MHPEVIGVQLSSDFAVLTSVLKIIKALFKIVNWGKIQVKPYSLCLSFVIIILITIIMKFFKMIIIIIIMMIIIMILVCFIIIINY